MNEDDRFEHYLDCIEFEEQNRQKAAEKAQQEKKKGNKLLSEIPEAEEDFLKTLESNS